VAEQAASDREEELSDRTREKEEDELVACNALRGRDKVGRDSDMCTWVGPIINISPRSVYS
jgi:hypothetical protein